MDSMYITCHNNSDNSLSLTIGRRYKVVKMIQGYMGRYYEIVDDDDLLICYNEYFFKSKEDLRDEKIDQLL